MTKAKKNIFKAGFASLAGFACLASLAACGSNKINPYDLDFTVDTKGATVRFWTGFGGDIQDIVELMCEEFSAKTGINVVTETKGGYDALYKAITLAATQRTYPHVALAYPDHMATYVNQDIILRLDYYLENDGDDTFKTTDFYADYMVENQTVEPKEDGSGFYTLGLPFNKSTELMTYNKTFFEWAPSQPGGDGIAVPATWDEVRSQGEKINAFIVPYFGKIVGTDNEIYTSTMDLPKGVGVLFDFRTVNADNFVPFSYDSEANFFITACRQWGGKYTEFDPVERKGYIAFDCPEVIQALTELKAHYDAKTIAIPSSFGGTTQYGSDYFKNLRSVMNVGSSAGVGNSCPKGDAFKVGIAPIPYKNPENKFVISQGTNTILLDTGTMAERVAAWKLVKYLTKEFNGFFAANTNYFPSCDFAVQSADYQKKIYDSNPDIQHEEGEIVSTAEEVWYRSTMTNNNVYMSKASGWTKFFDPAFIGSSTIRENLKTVMSRLMTEEGMTPRILIDQLKNELKDYVK